MRIATLGYAVAFAALAFAAPVMADIDTTGTDQGDVTEFGSVNTATYGQLFTPAAGTSGLASFSLFLRNRADGEGTLDLRGYLATWDGSKAGTLLYSSDTRTMNASGALQQFLFTPLAPIAITGGQQYVAFLSISDLPLQPQSTFGMPIGNDVIAGAFVFQNNDTDFGNLFANAWQQGFRDFDDVHFTADLIGVPEPSSWALMIGGFGLVGAALRRRRVTATT